MDGCGTSVRTYVKIYINEAVCANVNSFLIKGLFSETWIQQSEVMQQFTVTKLAAEADFLCKLNKWM